MKVKCVDSYLMKGFLTKGKIYNVELNEERGYTIVDDGGKLYVYAPYRFVVVDNSPVVTNFKTVVAMTSKFNGKKVVLSRTSEYIVLSENDSSYFVINDSGQASKYPKSNFHIVRG
jgi:hypothetical protein|nr:MAG TPA: hypothetical protein [Caudoviricetes sp.]